MPKKSSSELDVWFPNVNEWVFGGGWVEIGHEDRNGPFARALDEGGQIWEGKRKYSSLEDALKDLDRGIARWLKERG